MEPYGQAIRCFGRLFTVTDDDELLTRAARRRTFAVISHPDAGKSTITEALALHARLLSEAGAVKGRGNRRGVTSDWMPMERRRGISITSAALQFGYRDAVINLLDTPGHADFSEDTYRVVSAVDCAVMLLDSAKGLEPQTLKLFDVCRYRGIPVITFVNKWDRPGREPLELLDEIEQRIGLRPAPVTWPVGGGGEFSGVVDRRGGDFVRFTRASGGATAAPEEVVSPDRAAGEEGQVWQQARQELELLDAVGADFDVSGFLGGKTTPVFFGSALSNFGVRLLLDALVDLAPSPRPRLEISDRPRSLDAPFSGLVFKVQANMDPAHRDRIAFVRVCSGRFERGMTVTHDSTGRPFGANYAQQMFGRNRSTVDAAYPGDVVGLVNASALRVGDTLHVEQPVTFPGIPSFAPEHFATVRPRDSGRYKQFQRGVKQLDEESVVQILRSDYRGAQSPVLAAVGPMQFDVVTQRLEEEFKSPVALDRLPYQLARRTDADGEQTLRGVHGVEVMRRSSDEARLVLISDRWRLGTIERRFPDLHLEPLVANRDGGDAAATVP